MPVALALVIWKLLPDNPETAHFLTQPERDFIVRRLAEETGSGHGKTTNQDKIKKEHIIAGLSDWKSVGCRRHLLGKYLWCIRVSSSPTINKPPLWSRTHDTKHLLQIHSHGPNSDRRSRLHVRKSPAAHHPCLCFRFHPHPNLRVDVGRQTHALTLYHCGLQYRIHRLHRTARNSTSEVPGPHLRLSFPCGRWSVLSPSSASYPGSPTRSPHLLSALSAWRS